MAELDGLASAKEFRRVISGKKRAELSLRGEGQKYYFRQSQRRLPLAPSEENSHGSMELVWRLEFCYRIDWLPSPVS